MTTAKSIMVQGTASSSGKSLITAALCRIFHQDGHRVAPFKAQNMSNNSFVTRDGLEMGRAQVVQAYAAGLEPDVRMNPVLIKPSSDTGAQMVIKGKPAFVLDASQWHESRELLRGAIRECYGELAAMYGILVIEGAGSPAEINLKKNDVVNMGMAKMADAPVVIVGDIDKGGVFAALVGTMQLLDPDERARVKGFIINKFRGNAELLKPGLNELERLTGVPVLGVVPWIDHAIDEEDGVSERFSRKEPVAADVDICIIRLPHISNYTDFIPLESLPNAAVRWIDRADTMGNPDLLIIPGTKATIADLQTLRKAGIADAVTAYVHRGGTVLGICGGYQMLGKTIADPQGTESSLPLVDGLGLLDMYTLFRPEKQTAQTNATFSNNTTWLFSGSEGVEVAGYEIHMGASEYGPGAVPLLETQCADGSSGVLGISDNTGHVMGTYLHGLFDSGRVCSTIVNAIRARKKLGPVDTAIIDRSTILEAELDRLAQVVRDAVSMERVYDIVGGGK